MNSLGELAKSEQKQLNFFMNSLFSKKNLININNNNNNNNPLTPLKIKHKFFLNIQRF